MNMFIIGHAMMFTTYLDIVYYIYMYISLQLTYILCIMSTSISVYNLLQGLLFNRLCVIYNYTRCLVIDYN